MKDYLLVVEQPTALVEETIDQDAHDLIAFGGRVMVQAVSPSNRHLPRDA
ncbi:MAG TPA: hypothetical protein VG015_08025 [Candidatus Dormibacteraeota bacterium]|nr:hypothetical protein [Candidatus Dormibacteraeota bacterium]